MATKFKIDMSCSIGKPMIWSIFPIFTLLHKIIFIVVMIIMQSIRVMCRVLTEICFHNISGLNFKSQYNTNFHCKRYSIK